MRTVSSLILAGPFVLPGVAQGHSHSLGIGFNLPVLVQSAPVSRPVMKFTDVFADNLSAASWFERHSWNCGEG